MPSVHLTIKNLPQIRAAFGAAPRIMSGNLSRAIAKSAILIVDKSKLQLRSMVYDRPAPSNYKRTGNLLGRWSISPVSGFGMGMRAEVRPKVNYAIFVHEGTRFMRARPFLRQGVEDSQSYVEQFFEEAVQDTLNEIGRRV